MVEQIAVLLGLLEDGPKSSIALRDAMGVTAREIGGFAPDLRRCNKYITLANKRAGSDALPPSGNSGQKGAALMSLGIR